MTTDTPDSPDSTPDLDAIKVTDEALIEALTELSEQFGLVHRDLLIHKAMVRSMARTIGELRAENAALKAT